MLSALLIFKVQYTKKGDFGQLREIFENFWKEVKNLPEIHRLLEAVQLPQAMAIVHVSGHQKGEDLKAQGNRATDAAAREEASRDYATPY